MPLQSAHGRAVLLIASFVLASLSALPASGLDDQCGGAGQGQEPIRLCGTNTITGSLPTWVEVVIPQDVTIATPFGSSADLDVAGAGRFAGFVLEAIDTSTDTIIGGRFPSGDDPVEFVLPANLYSAPGGGNWDFLKFYPDEMQVPAGRYRLYLLTDGAPVEITLRLSELQGSAKLAPSHPADARLDFPGPRLLGGAGATKNVYGAGRSDTITGAGLLFHALWLDLEANAAGEYEFCHRPPGGQDLDPIELGPGCGAAADFELVNNRDPSAERETRLYMAGLDLVPSGRQHLGFWSASGALVNDLRYMQFWLSYAS